jgi:hypothetical protein
MSARVGLFCGNILLIIFLLKDISFREKMKEPMVPYETAVGAMTAKPQQKSSASDSSVVAKAALRAASLLDITDRDLARIIGVSSATISRMRKGSYPLDVTQKPFELAVLFVRLYRSLDAIAGGDDNVARKWIVNHNNALDGAPIELIKTVSGLANVIQYLDARRAIV